MAFFRVADVIEAPRARVWDLLRDWEGSSAWMVDATTVRVLGHLREGVGTRVEAVTRIAGIPIKDRFTVTAWQPEQLIAIMHHRWPIRGLAWWELSDLGSATFMEWAEELDPPLGPLGEVGSVVLRRPIERVLAKSLRKLRRLAESD